MEEFMSKVLAMSVATPVRSVLTPAQFNALPEDQKNKGLYILRDRVDFYTETSINRYEEEKKEE